MKPIRAIVNAVLVFFLNVVFSVCGLIPAILISGWISAITLNYSISFRYIIAGMEAFIWVLLIYYATKYLKHNDRVYLLYSFNALEKDAITSYFQTAIVGFAFGFIFFIPKYLGF